MTALPFRCRNLAFFLAVFAYALFLRPGAQAQSVNTILEEIEALEGQSDPKCYATASRLEDFMFGTPLSKTARAGKNELQKSLVADLWFSASQMTSDSPLDAGTVDGAIQGLFAINRDNRGHWVLGFPGGREVRINRTDKRQYSSIAYSLRALLAVQQESMMQDEQPLPTLSTDAVQSLKDAIDLYTLAVLKISDGLARSRSQSEVDLDTLTNVWNDLGGEPLLALRDNTVAPASKGAPEVADLSLTRAVIEQKVSSYAQYNKISNQLFIRNLQVFFAKQRWPETSEEATQFRRLYTETLIAMAQDLYRGAEALAIERGSALIQEQDVAQAVADYMPHTVNAYEDARFFPDLGREEQVFIEAYDMDAFRDSGIHWRYLQFALESDDFSARLAPDPFALELTTESIAQLGVLLLRLTGEVGAADGRERIALADLEAAKAVFADRADRDALAETDEQSEPVMSASATGAADATGLFSEVTSAVGIDYLHRSSDWLNRLLRSYLQKDAETGIITIPPAFGGSGIAAGDINNDGWTDILLLGGIGNRLYVNQGNGQFEDISAKAGIAWSREDDRRPGEARQPLIADLDNDGFQDIVITYVDDAHRVYRNNGDETFTDMTDVAALGGKGMVGGPATVFDFDNDGLLDLYINNFGNYLEGTLPTLARRNTNGDANVLFRNLGGFRFENATRGSGLENFGWGQALTHTDLNGDHRQDLIVGNDFGVNAYYVNNGDGSFTDIAAELGTDKPSYTMGIGLTDLNRDQQPDVYISNIVTMNKDQKYVLPDDETPMAFNPDKLANMRVIEANDLFLSQRAEGQLAYQLSDAVERGYSSTGWAWGAEFFDSDLDGDDDLYVLNGMNEFNLYSSENPYYRDPLEDKKQNVYIPVDTRETNVFFINDGGRLNNVSKASGLDIRSNSRSAAYLDVDNDGDLDIVMNNYHEAARVFRNDQSSDHGWLKISLRGNGEFKVNRDAIGARIVIYPEGGLPIWREIHGSSGYMTVQPKTQHVGLGSSDRVRIDITWPDGAQQTLTGIEANQHLTVDYPAPEIGEKSSVARSETAP